MSAEYEVQKAVFEAFNNSPGTDFTVYDDVPEDAEFPYIVIGETTTVPFRTKDSDGFEVSIIIHCWSRFDGREEVKQMMGQAYNVLHDSDLNVDGFDTCYCYWEFNEVFLESDGRTRHGIQRFNLTISPTPA